MIFLALILDFFLLLLLQSPPYVCGWTAPPQPASLFPHQSTIHECHPSSTKEETEAEEVYLGWQEGWLQRRSLGSACLLEGSA